MTKAFSPGEAASPGDIKGEEMKKNAKLYGAATAVAILLLIVGGVTSTILPLDEKGNVIRADMASEDGNYLDSHWDAMMSEVGEKAVNLQELLNAASDLSQVSDEYKANSNCFIVEGSGKITEANTESQAGYLVISLDGYSGMYSVQIQVGPVFKGTAFRDSLTCIGFSDFDNQMEWRSLSGEITEKIYQEVLSSQEANFAVGNTVNFKGCFTSGSSDTISIQPVELEVE